MLVEHARNVLELPDASHAEYGDGNNPIIAPLSCSLRGQEIDVQFTPDSRVHLAHGTATAHEKTTCDYGLRPDLGGLADSGGMRIAAVDGTGEVRAIERVDHPFFVGTLYQPQLSTSAGSPHPLFVAFIGSAARVSNRL